MIFRRLWVPLAVPGSPGGSEMAETTMELRESLKLSSTRQLSFAVLTTVLPVKSWCW